MRSNPDPAAAHSPTAPVSDERLRSVLAHWRALVRDGWPPERRQLDPADFAAALPYVWICERQPDTGRISVRLSGEEVNWLFGRNLRGAHLDEFLSAAQHSELAGKIDEVLSGPAVVLSRGPLFETDENGPVGECAMMPLREAAAVRSVLGATVYGPRPASAAGGLVPCFKEFRLLALADL